MIWWIAGIVYVVIGALMLWLNYEANYRMTMPWTTWLVGVFWLPIIVFLLALFLGDYIARRGKCDMPRVEMKGMENG